MILTKDNLPEWKHTLDEQFFVATGHREFSTSQRDEEWLKDYLGEDSQDVVNEEASCMASDD